MQGLDTFAHVVVRRVAALAPRWGVQIDIGESDAVVVELMHPYSRGLVFHSSPGLAGEEDGRLAWVERILADELFSWERALLADAPDPPHNPKAMVDLRVHAELFAWSNVEARSVSGLLADAGALTHDEHVWATRTVGEDAPDRPGANPAPSRWHWRAPTEPFGPRDARRPVDASEHGPETDTDDHA